MNESVVDDVDIIEFNTMFEFCFMQVIDGLDILLHMNDDKKVPFVAEFDQFYGNCAITIVFESRVIGEFTINVNWAISFTTLVFLTIEQSNCNIVVMI